MKYRINSICTNQIWTLVDLPKGIKLIGCKRIFTRKTNIDGMYKHTKLDYFSKVIDKDKGLTLMKPSHR